MVIKSIIFIRRLYVIAIPIAIAAFILTVPYIAEFVPNGRVHVPSTPLEEAWQFILKKEHWVFIHVFIPFQVSLVVGSYWIVLGICYLNESVEAAAAQIDAVYVVVSNQGNASYITGWIRESLMDSLLGDIINGNIGWVLGALFLKAFPRIRDEIISNKGFYFYRYALYFLVSIWVPIIASAGFIYDTAWGQIYMPVGFMVYPLFVLASLELFWILILENIDAKIGLTDNVKNRYVTLYILVFLTLYFSCLFLTVPTYPVVWVGSIISLIIIKWFTV